MTIEVVVVVVTVDSEVEREVETAVVIEVIVAAQLEEQANLINQNFKNQKPILLITGDAVVINEYKK
jgi:hypothetical protein